MKNLRGCHSEGWFYNQCKHRQKDKGELKSKSCMVLILWFLLKFKISALCEPDIDFFSFVFLFFFWCAMILSSFYFSQFHDVREESFPLKSIFPFLNKWFPLKFCCSLWWKFFCNTWKAKSAYNGLVFVCLTVASDISCKVTHVYF